MDADAGARPAAGGSIATAGYALVAVPLLAAVALLHHPLAHGQAAADILGSVRAQAGMDRLVHGVLMAAFGVLGAAMALFAARLGLARFTVAAGLVAFGAGVGMTLLAAATDGFVVPAVAAWCGAGADACAGQALGILRYGAVQVDVLTQAGMAATAAAVAAWSASLLSTPGVPGWTGWLGLASAACQATALALMPGRMSPRDALAGFAAQIGWYLLAGWLMVARVGPFGVRPPAGRDLG